MNGAREEKRVERPRENRRLESLRLALSAVAGSPRIDRRERGERGMTRANANPLSRGSGLARRSSWCRRPARSRGLKKRAFGRGARHLATTKSNAARTCRVEDAGLVRNARARTVWCPSRVRARSLGPRVRARRVECGASAAPSSFPPHPAVLKKRTESEKYLVPSATDCICVHTFSKACSIDPKHSPTRLARESAITSTCFLCFDRTSH